MFCPSCGTKVEDGAAFCGSCGTSIAEVLGQGNGTDKPAQEPSAQEGSKPGRQRKPFSKKMIGAIAGGAAVIAAIVIFIVIGRSAGDYENIAKKYAQALLSADFAKAYGYISLPESEFLSKDQFIIAMQDKKEVKNFSIKLKELSQAEKEAQAVLEKLGMSADEREVVFEVSYVQEGSKSASTKTLTVPMKKSDKKAMLFFSKWEVDGDSLISRDCTISGPKGAVFVLDGIKLEKYQDKAIQSKMQDVYRLEYIFKGTHKMKVTQEQCEDFEDTYNVNASKGANITCDRINIKSEVLKQVGNEAAEAVKILYENVIKKSDYETLPIKKPSDSEEAAALKKVWDNFMTSQVGKTGSGYNLTSVKWSQVRGSGAQYDSPESMGRGIKATVNLECDASFKSNTQERSGKVSAVATLYYRYQDGQWYIYNMNLRVLS